MWIRKLIPVTVRLITADSGSSSRFRGTRNPETSIHSNPR